MTKIRKTIARTQSASKPVKPRRAKASAAKPSAAKPAATRTPERPDLDAVLAALGQLQAAVDRMSAPLAADPEVDAWTPALHRLLSELMEGRLEVLARGVVDAVGCLEAGRQTQARETLDRVLDAMGVAAFEPGLMDRIDPLICNVVEECVSDNTPEGAVVKTVRPGFRTRRGRVLRKATVAVARRP